MTAGAGKAATADFRVIPGAPARDAATRRRPLSLPDLALLGILMDGPQHGYEMRLLIERRLGQLAAIATGTIYYTLQKLEKRGLVAMERGREGNRPEKLVYSITDRGREELKGLLKDAFFAEDFPYSAFDAALYFMPHGDLQDALDGATRQAERLRAFRDHVRSLEKAYPTRWPFNLESIKRHTLAVTDAHISFYEELQGDLRARIARARSRKPAAAPPKQRREHHG